LNPPPNFPMGVRAPARMTDEVMTQAPVVVVQEPFYGWPASRQADPCS
jgi:hypothetical protein